MNSDLILNNIGNSKQLPAQYKLPAQYITKIHLVMVNKDLHSQPYLGQELKNKKIKIITYI